MKIVERGLMSKEDLEEVERRALRLFAFGQVTDTALEGSGWRMRVNCIHCLHVCMYACICVYLYAFVFICMYVCICVCMYVCMHVYMYVCMYVCIVTFKTLGVF